jgi:hypothetical protein
MTYMFYCALLATLAIVHASLDGSCAGSIATIVYLPATPVLVEDVPPYDYSDPLNSNIELPGAADTNESYSDGCAFSVKNNTIQFWLDGYATSSIYAQLFGPDMVNASSSTAILLEAILRDPDGSRVNFVNKKLVNSAVDMLDTGKTFGWTHGSVNMYVQRGQSLALYVATGTSTSQDLVLIYWGIDVQWTRAGPPRRVGPQ